MGGCATHTVKEGNVRSHAGQAKETSKNQVEETKQKATASIQSPTHETVSLKKKETISEQTIPLSQKEQEKKQYSRDKRLGLYEHFLTGIFLKKRGKFDEASAAFSKALEITPESPLIGSLAGESLLQAKRVDEAIQVAEQSVKLASEEVESHIVLGRAYAAKQKYEKAIQEFEKVQKVVPDSFELLDELAQFYYKAQKYEDTIRIYRRLAEMYPEQSYLFRLFIADILLLKLNRLEEAKQEFQSIAQQIPNSAKVHLSLGRINELLGKPEEAIDAYLTALNHVRSTQEEMTIRKQLGNLYRERGSYTESLYQYQRNKEISPDTLETRQSLINLFIEFGKHEEALQEIDELVDKFPGDFKLQLLRKEILTKLERPSDAWEGLFKSLQYAIEHTMLKEIKDFLWQIAIDDSFSETITKEKHRKKVQELLQLAGDTFPNTPRIAFAQARLNLTGQSSALRVHLQKILDLFKQNLETADENTIDQIAAEMRLWYRVRHAFHDQGYSRDLIDILRECRKKYPENRELTRILGMIFAENDQLHDAEEMYLTLKETVDPENPIYKELLFQLAFVYERMNRIADVERLMKEAIQRFPDDPEAYNFLGYTYADHNMHLDEALQLIEKALKDRPNDGNYIDSLGWVYYRMGKYEEAITHLRRALDNQADHPVILDHLGDAYEEHGQLDTAIRCWKKVLEVGPQYPLEYTSDFHFRVVQKIQAAENSIKQ